MEPNHARVDQRHLGFGIAMALVTFMSRFIGGFKIADKGRPVTINAVIAAT